MRFGCGGGGGGLGQQNREEVLESEAVCIGRVMLWRRVEAGKKREEAMEETVQNKLTACIKLRKTTTSR